MGSPENSEYSIFISYSHRDEAYRLELEHWLAGLVNEKLIQEPWYDRRTQAGEDWEGEIDERLRSAQIVLLLLTQNFVNSRYCVHEELPVIEARHKAGELLVIPIFLEEYEWEGAFFNAIQGSPDFKNPLSKQEEKNDAYRKIVKDIRAILQENPPSAHSRYFTSIPVGIETFVGREKDLAQIHDLLKQRRVVLLHGMGGMGKTVLAKRYLELHGDEWNHCGFLLFKSKLEESLFDEDLLHFTGCDRLQDAREIVDCLYRKLKRLPGKKLLVLDNVENVTGQQLREFLSDFHLLITTRDELRDVAVHEVGTLPHGEAVQLFQKHYEYDIEPNTLDALLKEIETHTLLIEMVARTLREHSLLKPEEMLAILQKKELGKRELLNIEIRKTERPIYEHLAELFQLSQLKTQLDTEEGAITPLRLLQNLSILPSMNLSGEELLSMLAIEEENQPAFEKILNDLAKHGWLIRNRDRTLRCHPIIQHYIHITHKPTYEDCKEMVQYFINESKRFLNTNPLKGTHLLEPGSSILQHLTENHAKLATLANNLSLIYQYLGRLNEALEYAKKSVRILEHNFPGGHKNLDVVRENLQGIEEQIRQSESGRE